MGGHKRRIRIGDLGMVADTKTKKLVGYSPRTPGVHFTFNFGGKSGIIDFHRTEEGGAGLHQTIYAISAADIPALCLELTARLDPSRALSFLRPLRLGWLHHHHIGFVTGLFLEHEPESDIRITTEDLQGRAKTPEWLEDIYDAPDVMFPLMKVRRHKPARWVGIAIKVPRPAGHRLFWLKLRDLNRLARKMMVEGEAVFERYRAQASF